MNIFISVIFSVVSILFAILFIALIRDKKTIVVLPSTISNKYKIAIFLLAAIVVSYAQVFITNFIFPYIGHDTILVESRMISMLIYGLKNGIFAKEWATPLWGAGLLQYANPQFPQFSVLYFLNFIMPFWDAYLFTMFIFSIIGFVSVYFIFQDIFKYDYQISLTGAIFFSCTGYYSFHMMVGHWTFIYHPLTAFVVWVFFSPRFKFVPRLLLTAVTFSIMIFGGSLTTIFFYTCFTLLGCAALLFKPNKDFFVRCATIVLSVMLSFVLSLSKILPSFMLSAKINRGDLMLHNVPFWKIFENIYYSFIVSTLSFFENVLMLRYFVNIEYKSLWERDMGFSFLILVVSIIIWVKYKKEIMAGFKDLWKTDRCKIVFFVAFILLYVDMFYDWGITHRIMPMLNSINLHLRLASALILPIIFIFCYLLKNFDLAQKNRTLFFIFINVVAISFFVYRHTDILVYDKGVWINSYVSIENYRDVWKNIKNNYDKYEVVSINNNSTEYKTLYAFDTDAFKQFYDNYNNYSDDVYRLFSSQIPYEPIYGYSLETFKPKEVGDVKQIIDGRYNFTHPNSLLFFDENFPPFSGFAIDQEDDLDKFLHFEAVDWQLPQKFIIADKISIISYIIVLSILILYGAIGLLQHIRNRCQNNA